MAVGETSKIEWTDATFNPWIGCQKVSPGCDRCYAETLVSRWKLGSGEWGPKAERRRTSGERWDLPRRLQARADAFFAKHGRRQRLFCASLADVFDNKAPRGARSDLFKLIRECPDLDWQLLTKRPQNIGKMLPKDWGHGYRNVWLGITAEDQAAFAARWPLLAATPASIRFISYEPALGPLRLNEECIQPDWLISGGESGGHARPMAPDWARSVRDQCMERKIAYFHKQWGSSRSNPLVVEQGLRPTAAKALDANGKSGALIDGRLWRQFPALP